MDKHINVSDLIGLYERTFKVSDDPNQHWENKEADDHLDHSAVLMLWTQQRKYREKALAWMKKHSTTKQLEYALRKNGVWDLLLTFLQKKDVEYKGIYKVGRAYVNALEEQMQIDPFVIAADMDLILDSLTLKAASFAECKGVWDLLVDYRKALMKGSDERAFMYEALEDIGEAEDRMEGLENTRLETDPLCGLDKEELKTHEVLHQCLKACASEDDLTELFHLLVVRDRILRPLFGTLLEKLQAYGTNEMRAEMFLEYAAIMSEQEGDRLLEAIKLAEVPSMLLLILGDSQDVPERFLEEIHKHIKNDTRIATYHAL